MKRKTKTEEDRFKDFCDKVVARLCRHFFLTNYDYRIVYEVEQDPEAEGGHCNAEITVNDAYMYFQLTIYRNCFRGWQIEPAKAFHCLLHEFCHHLTLPPYRFADPHMPDTVKDYHRQLMERQTEQIARLLLAQPANSIRAFFDKVC